MVGSRRSACPVFLCLLNAAFAQTQPDPWAVVPDDALGFVAVQRLADANTRIHKLTSAMQLQVPDVLPIVQLMTGMLSGLDEQGSAVACAFADRRESAISGMSLAVFVPVLDYKSFLIQLRPKTPDAEITEVDVSGQPMLAAQKAGFVVLCATDQRYVLEHILSSKRGIAGNLGPLRTWLDQQQIAVVVTSAGLRVLSEQAAVLIDEELKQFVSSPAEPGDEPSGGNHGLGPIEVLLSGAKELLASATSQVTHLSTGLRIDDQSALLFSNRVAVAADSDLARWASSIEVPRGGPLVGLPAGKFSLAYGGVTANPSNSLVEIFNRLGVWFYQLQGLHEEPLRQYTQALNKLSANGLSSTTMLGQLRPGDNIMSTLLLIDRVKNAEEHFRLTRQTWQIIAAANAPADGESRPRYVLKDVTVGELKALEVSIDANSRLKQVVNDEVQIWLEGFMAQIFGKDGVTRAYLTVAEPGIVVTAFSKELLQHGVRHARARAPGLESDPGIANTAALLPRGAQWALYVSPQGILQIVDTLVRETVPVEITFQVPPFPASDPVGFGAHVSPEMLEAVVVLPASVVAGIGQYLNTLEDMIERGELRLP